MIKVVRIWAAVMLLECQVSLTVCFLKMLSPSNWIKRWLRSYCLTPVHIHYLPAYPNHTWSPGYDSPIPVLQPSSTTLHQNTPIENQICSVYALLLGSVVLGFFSFQCPVFTTVAPLLLWLCQNSYFTAILTSRRFTFPLGLLNTSLNFNGT